MSGPEAADDGRAVHPPGAPAARTDGTGVDVTQLAERVYRLLLDDVRLEQTRRGTWGVPRRG